MHLLLCQIWQLLQLLLGHTSMADTSVVDLDSDFMFLGRSDLDVFDGEILASFPGDCSLDAVRLVSLISQ